MTAKVRGHGESRTHKFWVNVAAPHGFFVDNTGVFMLCLMKYKAYKDNFLHVWKEEVLNTNPQVP